MNCVILSNTCTGKVMYTMASPGVSQFSIDYPSPLIATLFVDDMGFVRFVKDYDYYPRQVPEFVKPCEGAFYRDTGDVYFGHEVHPVMRLGDVEIHWIHENVGSENAILRKWHGRIERGRGMPRVAVLSASELLNLHAPADRDLLRDEFMKVGMPSLMLSERAEDVVNVPNHRCDCVPGWSLHNQWDRDNAFFPVWNHRPTVAAILLSKIPKVLDIPK